MKTHNSYYFNACNFLDKLLLLVICCFLLECGGQKQTQQVLSSKNQVQVAESAINVNTASAEELEKLPHISAKTAREIIEHREKFGKFRKPEHLLLVRGIGDKRFRQMQSLIKVE
ncbi:hypothetical protein BH18ACI1_BH18ACI1_12690 [soil metagenome]|jgi:competence ComEA-like helix-hairpin-helix protein|nr:helix-hairpin-helix domain-containing protein [Acidobacteriota bacterium]